MHFFDLIPYNSLMAALFILFILCLSSFILFIKKKIQINKDFTELSLRIRSWWWMIGILFTVLFSGEYSTIVFFGFISFLCLKEFLSIIPTQTTDRRVIFWAYIAIPIQYYWIYTGWYNMFLIFIPVYAFLFLPMRRVLIGENKGFINSSGTLHLAIMICIYCISYIAYFANAVNVNPNAGFIGLIIFLLFTTQFNDVAQYVWGKLLGKHKVIPKVSPNKTVEGLIGGIITTSIFAYFLGPLLTPMSALSSLFIGFVLGLLGFIGDVVMSAIKRDLGIKDTGYLIAGHGGILDRLDSVIYTAPIFFHFINYFYSII